MPFYAIAAMSENRVIGDQGKIPWHLPEDFRWFKHKTMGGTLIMGRKTFESIGKPLPGRETIVLSQSLIDIPSVTVCADLLEFLIKEIADKSNKTYWICGGGTVYKQFFAAGHCQYLYLTIVKRQVAGDVFLPPFENALELDETIHENADFRVERWKHKNPNLAILASESWPFPERPS